MSFKNALFIAFLTIVLIFLVECFSQLYLKKSGNNKNLFFNSQETLISKDENLRYYKQIDPLLGWSISNEDYEISGYTEEHNATLLKSSSESCADFYHIYITGGSTTDIVYDKDNWPLYLLELLNEQGFCVKIYVASVAGYNSGQELLKLIRDLAKVNPDLHISYSGANEMEHPAYTSYYEESLFSYLTSVRYSSILPNTTYLLRAKFFPQNNKLKVRQTDMDNAFEFWERNMRSMHALARDGEYDFIGILQPVLGFGSPVPDNIKDDERFFHHIEDNMIFYPKAMLAAEKHVFIHDFTILFRDTKENVFRDDCHLKTAVYQKMVATEIFKLIALKLD